MELQEGKIYSTTYVEKKNQFIFQYRKSEDSSDCWCIREYDKYFSNNFVFNRAQERKNLNDLRLATEEEIEWFNLCKENGEYMPKPEKLKTIEYEYF